MIEASHLQARTEAAERKAVETVEEVATARAMALPKYHSSFEFQQVCEEQFDEGARALLCNAWLEHPE